MSEELAASTAVDVDAVLTELGEAFVRDVRAKAAASTDGGAVSVEWTELGGLFESGGVYKFDESYGPPYEFPVERDTQRLNRDIAAIFKVILGRDDVQAREWPQQVAGTAVDLSDEAREIEGALFNVAEVAYESLAEPGSDEFEHGLPFGFDPDVKAEICKAWAAKGGPDVETIVTLCGGRGHDLGGEAMTKYRQRHEAALFARFARSEDSGLGIAL